MANFFGGGGLGGDAQGGLVGGQGAGGLEALHLQVLIADDDPDRVAALGQAGFDEADRIEHQHRC